MTADLQRRKELGLIHAARKQLAIEDSSYRALLVRVTGKDSSAELDAGQRSAVIAELRRLGFRYEPHKRRRPSAGLWPLAAKARALWWSLHALGELRDASDDAFTSFARRQTGVERPEWLTPKQWNATIEALKAMCERAGFKQPLPEEVVAIDASREHLGKPAGGIAFAAKVHLIRAQWKRLIALGAMETGANARLDTWLMSRFRDQGQPVREPYWLALGDADRAIGQLGEWIRAR